MKYDGSVHSVGRSDQVDGLVKTRMSVPAANCMQQAVVTNK